MALLGILGGMSWESTASYYRLLNEGYRDAKADFTAPFGRLRQHCLAAEGWRLASRRHSLG